MRLFITTFGTLILIAFILVTVHMWGLGQSLTEFQHPFFETLKASSASSIGYQVSSIESMSQRIKKNPEASLFWLDVRISDDQKVFILPPSQDSLFLKNLQAAQAQSPQSFIYKSNQLSKYSFSEITQFFGPLDELEKFFITFPKAQFILNIVDNVFDADMIVTTHLKNSAPDNRTLITSETHVIVTSIKKAKPLWLYGTSQSELLRFLVFDSLWILPAMNMFGDVFVAPIKTQTSPSFNEDILTEVRRRNKKVVVGPVQSEEDVKAAQLFLPDYIIKGLSVQ